MAIGLSERAASEIRTIIEQQKLPEQTFLRVGVKGGGCSGFSYSLDLTDSMSENDETFDQHGVKVVCDPKSYLYSTACRSTSRTRSWGAGSSSTT
ncbi:MAG: iron-sulfur cluster assembly accessory protein [Phycisphaerae bacterium]